MSTAKNQIRQIPESQSDEILKESAFKRMIDRGLADVDANNTISNEEMEYRIKSCHLR